MTKKIRKAIIPAAGFGTRFLPATKAQPKEMMPIVDKPIIQYVVEDAVSAGIEDIIIVTGWHKRNIEDHFDYPFELEKRLEHTGKQAELDEIRRIAEMANFYYVRQKGPLGNATPVWNARKLVGDEPFLVLWGDDVLSGSPTRSQQLVAAYEKLGGGVVVGAMRKGQPDDFKRYGYAVGQSSGDGSLRLDSIIEKPGTREMAGSDLALIGGYAAGPEMFDAIEEAMRRREQDNTPGELVYVDAVNILLERGVPCHATEFQGVRYHDCGNKLEYLKAVVEFGLQHDDLRAEFRQFLDQLPAS